MKALLDDFCPSSHFDISQFDPVTVDRLVGLLDFHIQPGDENILDGMGCFKRLDSKDTTRYMWCLPSLGVPEADRALAWECGVAFLWLTMAQAYSASMDMLDDLALIAQAMQTASQEHREGFYVPLTLLIAWALDPPARLPHPAHKLKRVIPSTDWLHERCKLILFSGSLPPDAL